MSLKYCPFFFPIFIKSDWNKTQPITDKYHYQKYFSSFTNKILSSLIKGLYYILSAALLPKIYYCYLCTTLRSCFPLFHLLTYT